MKTLLGFCVGLILGFISLWLMFSYVESQTVPNQAFFAPSGDKRILHEALIKELNKAKKTVKIAMFQWTSRSLSSTVIALKKNVNVQILLDEEQIGASWSQSEELKKAGIEIKYLKLPGSGTDRVKMHHKFLIVDGKVVATGSMNWTILADEKNYEALVVLYDEKLAKKFSDEFDKAWNSAVPWK